MKINLKDRNTKALFGIVGALILCVVILVAYLLIAPASKIIAIELKNKAYSEVVEWEKEKKIKILYSYEYNDEIEKDKVISQNIQANKKFGSKDEFKVVISKGPDPSVKVPLPDFTGKKAEDITAFIEKNKLLDATIDYVADAKIPLGGFIKLNTVEKEVARGSMLIFTVSKGPEGSVIDITVPDFSTYTKTKIDEWGKLNSVQVVYKEEYSETIAKGKVIKQDPSKDTVIQSKSKITITLSSGKIVKAKDLTGMSKDEVNKWANENNVKITYQEYYKNKNEGKVVRNSPSSGNIAQGSTITAVVSLGKPNIEDYTSKKLNIFDSWLEGINKKIEKDDAKIGRTVVYAFSDSVEKGTIISQSIKGTKVELGTNIELKVSKGREINGKNFANKPESDITAWINTNKLVKNRIEKYSDSVASGNVISNTFNTEGNLIEEGTTITYEISLGAYQIPKFSGTLAQAQATINAENAKGAGVTLNNGGEVYDSSTAKGLLIASRQAENGKVVTVYISKGKAPVMVTVPIYVGKSAPCAAGQTCTDSQLRISVVVETNYNENVPAGQVISQSIAAGTSVEENTAIRLTVSKGSEPSATINYGILNGSSVEETTGNVNTTLRNAGFTNFSVSSSCHVDLSVGIIIPDLSTVPGVHKLSERITVVISNGKPC